MAKTDNPNPNQNPNSNRDGRSGWKEAPPSGKPEGQYYADTQRNAVADEFKNSQAYRVLNQVSGAGDKVANGLNRAAAEISRAVDTVSRSVNQAVGTAKKPQNYNYNYHYNYNQKNTPGPQSRPQPVPRPQPMPRPQPAPRPQPRPTQRVQPVPPPAKPVMVQKRMPSNGRYWFTGIVCLAYALFLPLYSWAHLVIFGAVALGAFFLGGKLFRGKKYLVPAETPKPAPPVPEKKSATGNPEVDKIIDDGHEYLKQLHAANDRIPDEVMSDRIHRMEVASSDIFNYISETPAKAAQIRRFMSYYLPTTMKLLTSYEKLSRQRVKGENIQKTMFEIEGMMETIAAAFEKQLDGLFSDDAMDISADISVMESVLKQEGLSDAPADMPQAEKKEAASPLSGMPTLTLDPNEADEKK